MEKVKLEMRPFNSLNRRSIEGILPRILAPWNPFVTKEKILEKEIDPLWKISRTNFSLSLSRKCIEKSVEPWRSIEMQLEFRESAVKVLEYFSSRVYRYILQLMANGKSIPHRDSSYEFHGQRYNSLGSRENRIMAIKSYVLTDV